MDPEVASTYEAVMVHELFHVFGAVAPCAPNFVEGSHVRDDTEDLMYAGVERGARAEAVIDLDRNDYYGHGREDCLDVAGSRYWELLPPGAAATRAGGRSRLRIPAADRPLRCGLH